MARKPRFNLPGVPQHIVQRGNNREACFYIEADYCRYLENLHEASAKNHAVIHAYVLMTNHVHILATPGQPFSITHLMQDLGRKYVRNFNRAHGRTGTLWEGRYKASLIDSESYLLACMRYIEMNPVRARMVSDPASYRWSSYHCNADGVENDIITPHPIYQSIDREISSRKAAYRELVRLQLDEATLNEIRVALNQEGVLGGEGFKDRMEQLLERRVRPGKPGRPRIQERLISVDFR